MMRYDKFNVRLNPAGRVASLVQCTEPVINGVINEQQKLKWKPMIEKRQTVQ